MILNINPIWLSKYLSMKCRPCIYEGHWRFIYLAAYNLHARKFYPLYIINHIMIFRLTKPRLSARNGVNI